MKKQPLILLLFLFTSPLLWAQTNAETDVMAVVHRLFEGMRQGDSTMVRSVFHPNAQAATTFLGRDQKPITHTDTPQSFIEAVGKPKTAVWDERIYHPEVRVGGTLATVWARYEFYLGDKFSHCGYDAFQMVNTDRGWKVLFLSDTRQMSGCEPLGDRNQDAALNQFIDAWHRGAATADETVFFGSMTEDAIYLGTDETERWVKPDFQAWSKPYFDRDKAWDFTPKNRHIMYSPDGKMAWWDELLDTWMGVCRGSGVLIQTEQGWKIKHYNLAVTIPNDKINGFIELVTGKKPKK